KIKVVSVVGNDFPEDAMQMLRSRKVDLDGVEIKKDGKTFFWKGKYHNDLNTRDTLVTELNVLGDFNPILPLNYKTPDFLLLGNLSPQVQSSVINQLENKPKLIAMDTMNFWMDIAMDDLTKTIGMVDLLVVNDEEARQLSKEYSLVKAAKIIRAMGPKYLIIKKGEHGALLFHNDDIFFAPALPLEVVFDPTGAGDTFAAGFMAHLAKTGDISFENMKRAVIYGSAMASFCVEKFGLERLLELNPSLIEERVNRFVELVKFDVATLAEAGR
ncbi:MAG: PfkB family carbohydrate kinase, partial [Bacteroidetes bacterium]|nr:PfkB family carbohydrate kinase [Bacteroidota bacterium]